MISAIDNYPTTQQVLNKIDADTGISIRDFMGGDDHENLDLLANAQYPLSQVTSLSQTAHADSVNDHHALLGPYKKNRSSASAPSTSGCADSIIYSLRYDQKGRSAWHLEDENGNGA